MTESSVVVTNTGPLIALATVRRVALLGQMYGSVLVPEAVFQEVTAQGPHRPGAAELASAPWAIRSTLLAPPDPFLAGNLGKGEAEAITLAVQRSARWVLMDDRRARRIAELAYRLQVKGVAGILVAAKRKGLISKISSLLTGMQAAGYYLSQAVVERALQEAGESRYP
jgi:predicted nucleic acid-binding protein